MWGLGLPLETGAGTIREEVSFGQKANLHGACGRQDKNKLPCLTLKSPTQEQPGLANSEGLPTLHPSVLGNYESHVEEKRGH